MKIDWKKAIGLTAAVSMLVPLAACGGSSDGGDKNASGSTEAVTLSVWAPQEDQAKDTNWLGKVEENFAKAHPEYNITWKNDVVSEGDASKQVSTDPSAAADVYMFASDQLGVLMDAKAIGQLGTDAEKQVKEQNGDLEVNSVTGTDGKLYGVPYTDNTWFMYYNKSKITALEDWYDVSKLEAVVVANEYGSLKDGSALKEGKTSIVITSENNKDIAYNISDATTYDFTTSLDMLGKSIVVFAKDSKTVVGSVTSSDNNVVVTTTESLDKDDWKDLLDSNDLSVPAKVQISGNYGKAAEGTDPAGNKAGVETTLIDNDDDGTVDFIIQVQSYLGKVTKYNTSGQGAINVKTADGKTLSYSDQDDVVGFADVAKDDYVIATEVCGTLYVNKAETVAGDLTAYKTNSSLTVNGEKYSVVTYNSDPSKVDSDLKTGC